MNDFFLSTSAKQFPLTLDGSPSLFPNFSGYVHEYNKMLHDAIWEGDAMKMVDVLDGSVALRCESQKIRAQLMEAGDDKEKLLRTLRIEMNSSRWKNTPLMIACSIGRVDMIKTLMKWGADSNYRHSNGDTPLFSAIKKRQLLRTRLTIESNSLGQQNIIGYLIANLKQKLREERESQIHIPSWKLHFIWHLCS